MGVMTGGDVLIETLAREGARLVFSMPGGQLLPIYDAIREHPKLELVTPRHEGAASIMACGAAMAGGGLGVVMSTVGAGVIYEAGGLLLAWRERLPVLSIAPQVQSYRMKPIQESLQACDQDEIFRPFTKFKAIAYHYKRIPQLTRRAIRIARAPEPGPIHLDVPVDVLFEFKRVSGKKHDKLFAPGVHSFKGEVQPGTDAMCAAAEIMANSRRPVALVGRGALRAGAAEELKSLLGASPLPAITSSAAFSVVGKDQAWRLGLAEWWESGDALSAISGADLLLVVEADEETGRLARALVKENPSVKVVQAAELMASIGTLTPVDAGLIGTPGAVMAGLAGEVGAASTERDVEWMETLMGIRSRLERSALDSIGPGPRLDGTLNALDAVNKVAKEGDVVVCEGPMAAGAAAVTLSAPGPGGAVLLSDAVPGAGLPLSMGMKSARPESDIYLVTDSASFKRHSRELQSMKRYGFAVNVMLFQSAEQRPEEEVDFTALAKSFGVPAREVIDPVEEIGVDELRESAKSKDGMLFDASK